MITCTSDTFWNQHTLGCPDLLRPWLHDRSSLTRRIQQRCQHFQVKNLHSGLAHIAYDEARLLSIPPHQLAYSREVFLCADNQAVVFAHSCCARPHLQSAWGAIAGLGSRPLGALLFSHPQVTRMPLHFQQLRPHHPLQQKSGHTSPLWARRSLFYLRGAPLLVTEVFLPGIAKLSLNV